MRVAFTCWENRIAPVFDTARQVHVIETAAGKVVDRNDETLPLAADVHKALRLVELGVDTLICGAISRPAQAQVAGYGIQVIAFVKGNLTAVVEAWLRGRLVHDAFVMPGCRRRGRGSLAQTQSLHAERYAMKEKASGRERSAGMGAGRGRGGQRGGRRMGAGAAGATGHCLCPKCGHREAHQRGMPCVERTCPDCGTLMTREW